MRAKLLKRIRERYSWHYNKYKKHPLDLCVTVCDHRYGDVYFYSSIEGFITKLAFQQSFWYGWLREDKVIGRQKRLEYYKQFKRIA